MHRVELDLKLCSGKVAEAIWRALVPESRVALRNVKVSVALSGDHLSVVMEAEDESALRAALNSFTKLVYLASKVLEAGWEACPDPR